MRFLLTLQVEGKERLLPINYQYPISAWIYKLLENSDSTFSQWLHDVGFRVDHKKFRFFCFGELDVRPFRREGDRLRLLGQQVRLVVSFALPNSGQHFLQGLFAQQRLRLADQRSGAHFAIDTIEMLPEPVFDQPSVRLRTAAVVISRPNARGHADYLHPDEPDYAERLYLNLTSKLQAYATAEGKQAGPFPPYSQEVFDLEVLSKPRSRLVTIAAGTPRETRVRGYSHECVLRCETAWQGFIWKVGLGEKGSQGFGLIELA